MFQAWGIIGNLANLAIIAVVAYFFIKMYLKQREEARPREEHERYKSRLMNVAVVHQETGDPDHVSTETANRTNLEFGKTPGFKAGQTIMNLPVVNPIKEGKSTTDPTIVAVLRMVVYRRGDESGSKEESSDLAVTNTGGLTGVVGGKRYVFNPLNLTSSQKQDVEDEREEVVKRGDTQMPNILGDGRDWTIKRAMGKNNHPKPRQHACSYLQVMSALDERDGFGFPFTPRILDQDEHTMFDVLAVNNKDDEVFYAFWTCDEWHCFLGREVSETENAAISVQ